MPPISSAPIPALKRRNTPRRLPLRDIPQGWEVELVRDILTRRAAGSVYREADVKQEGAIPVLDQSTNELLGFPRPGEPPYG
jgi:hypothetical protein